MATILLVEDDEMIARMISMRLQMVGYTVDRVENGLLAVERALATPFDLILMDMHMPVMDGHEATRKLRQANYSGKIVAVTASVMSVDSEAAVESGCDTFISKPIGADFEARIEALLNTL